MRALPLVGLALIVLGGCATSHTQSAAALKRETDAVVVNESQRQKVLDAINAGATPDEAMATVAEGPKNEKPVPN